MDKGYIHVYTGNGKGKTTAALGLAVRGVSAGKKVFFAQFIKGMAYSELKSQDFMPNFKIQQFGKNCFIYNDPTEEDVKLARNGLESCKEILKSGEYDIVVLDELNIAVYYKLFTVEEVIETIKSRASHVEVIITGRYADDKLIEIADLVTDMKEVKHYYMQGIESRRGIDC